MRTLAWALSGALALAAVPAWAATDRDRQDCDARDADRNIAGCTRIAEDAHESSVMRSAAYVARGLAWQSKGDTDHALSDFNAAIRINPKDSLAYNNRGMLWRERGDADRAIADFTAAIAIDPLPRSDEAFSRRGKSVVPRREVNIYENRALTLLERSDFDGAIADFDQAIAYTPDMAQGYFARAESERAIGDMEAAKRDHQHARIIDGR